jgi:ubiquinone/menaquinone biosynthesis C-methylase UbiE
MSAWDYTSNQEFYTYYAEASQSPEALQRFRSIRDCVLRVASRNGFDGRLLEVADIGCGAGTQSFVWSELFHRVHALDVNQPLLDLARERAERQGYTIDFRLGSATELPWDKESMDVCLLIELLEHVPQWERCLDECARVLRPNGILYLTTSNKLCPVQKEFNLPLYSWYPAPLKRHFERLSMTRRPDLANYAKYPAVNWFSFYELRAELSKRGFDSLDRFDVMDFPNKQAWIRVVVHCMRAVPPLRWLGHVATPGTLVLAVRRSGG